MKQKTTLSRTDHFAVSAGESVAWSGKTGCQSLPDPRDQGSVLLSLPLKVWRHGSVDVQAVKVSSKEERSSEEDDCRAGFGNGDS
jgi:hypothetical protein